MNITANNISESIRQAEIALNRIRQIINDNGAGTLRATWAGPASTHFYKQFNSDEEIFSSHMRVLQTLNSQLREAAGIFDAADNRALELVNQLRFG
jgi:WXG100 family type VII secretion target